MMIEYKIKTKSTLLPITLAEVKTHLRLGSDTTQDTLIQSYIDAAIIYVENQTGRKLMTQTWSLICDTWEEAKRVIKFGQLGSITSVKYLDEDESSQTVSSDDYRVYGVGTDKGRVVFYLDGDFDYPATFEVEPITIEFICGYDLLVNDVLPNIIPESLQNAIMFKVSDLFSGECTQDIVSNICNDYRLWCFNVPYL